MAAVSEFKYRAFLCNAYGDETSATALLKRIKGYRLDGDFAMRAKLAGPKDGSGRARLKPIYTARYLSMSGTSLPADVVKALDASSALVVICTSMASGDRAVGEVVRYFKHRHPDRPVLPVIPEGSFGTGLPPALRFAMNPDGTIGRDPIKTDVIDLRETADGKSFGMARVASGLLGLEDANALYRHAHVRDSRRSLRTWTAGLAALGLALGGAVVWGETNRQRVDFEHSYGLTQAKLATDQTAAAESGRKEVVELRKLIDAKAQEAAAQQKSGGEQNGQAAQLRKEADDLRKLVTAEQSRSGQVQSEAQGLRKAAVERDAVIAQLRKDIDGLRTAAKAADAKLAVAQQPKVDAGAQDKAAADQLALIAKLRLDVEDQRKAAALQTGVAEQRGRESEQLLLTSATRFHLIESLRKELDEQRKATLIQNGLAEQRGKEAAQLRLASGDQSGLVERLRKEVDDQRKATEIQSSLAEQRRKEAETQNLALGLQLGLMDQLRKDVETQKKLAADQSALSAQRLADVDALRKGVDETKALAAKRGQETEAQRAAAEKLRMDSDKQLATHDENADALVLTMLQAMRGHPDLIGKVSDTLLSSIERRASDHVDDRATSADSLRRQAAIFDELAVLHASRGNTVGRAVAVQRSLDASLRLAEVDRGSPAALGALANSYSRAGDLNVAKGDLSQAMKSYQAAVFLRERVAGADAKNGDAHLALAKAHEAMGRLRTSQRDTPGAQASYKAALAAALRLPEPGLSETGHVTYVIALHRSLLQLGDDPQAHRGDIARLIADLKTRGVIVSAPAKGASAAKVATAPSDAPSDSAVVATKPVVKHRRPARKKVDPAATASIFGG